MERVYHIPINDSENGTQSVTMDIVTLTGKKQKRKHNWRKYLFNKYKIRDGKKIAIAMGFQDLI